MRSRAEPLLRLVGVAAIAAWVANALVPRAGAPVAAAGTELATLLPRWTRDPGASVLHVSLDTTPDPAAAAWLAALRGAGARVTWSGALVPLAIEAHRAVDPRGNVMVRASMPNGVSVIADGLGTLDTLRGEGATLRLASVEDGLTLRMGAQSARVPVTTGGRPRGVFVAGTAGWEAKFVIAALEEAGWQVDARLAVGPGMDVVQGRRMPLDTATYAAVVLLDSAAAEAVRGIDVFARSGGGVVLAGEASRARRVASLTSWRARPREVAGLGTLAGDTAWRGLSRVPLEPTPAGAAIPLETRDGAAVVVARRHHAGRVLAVGYDATWRWRMGGADQSVAEHRAWWTRIVSSVAAALPSSGDARTGAAPVATLVGMLGPPAERPANARAPFPRGALANVLGLIAMLALLGEWFLRRARGAR